MTSLRQGGGGAEKNNIFIIICEKQQWISTIMAGGLLRDRVFNVVHMVHVAVIMGA